MSTQDDHQDLVIAIQAAVQLTMLLELAPLDAATRDTVRARWAADAVDPVASTGDALQFGGKRGQAATAFNAFVKGLAALAYQPGGVTAFGQHWCANHAECQSAAAEAEVL